MCGFTVCIIQDACPEKDDDKIHPAIKARLIINELSKLPSISWSYIFNDVGSIFISRDVGDEALFPVFKLETDAK